MTNYVMSKYAYEELEDIHVGVHAAMDNLINRKNNDEAERILRIIDAKLANLINNTKAQR